MSENVVKVEEAQDVLYKPGISFMNPALTRVVAPVRSNPWFYEEVGVGPLSASAKLRRFNTVRSMQRYKPVWSRAVKSRNTAKLGAFFSEVPTMNELGAAPPASGETNAASRNPLGFLDNILTAAEQGASSITDALVKREVQKTASAQAQMAPYIPYFNQGGSGGSTLLILAGVAAVGIGAYFFLRR